MKKHLQQIVDGTGAGSQLWRLLSDLGVEHKEDCPCVLLAYIMNLLGPDGCEEQRAKILSVLKKNKKKYGWNDHIRAALSVVCQGLVFQLNPLDPLSSLFDLAVQRTVKCPRNPEIPVVINCDTHGFGDCMTMAWIAEGAKSSCYNMRLQATGEKAKLLKMLGQVISGRVDDAIQLTPLFSYDQNHLSDPTNSRLQSWMQCLNLHDIIPKRPVCSVSEIAVDAMADLISERMVLLFPQSVRANREWPPVYWIELAERFKRDGYVVYVLCNHSIEFKGYSGYLGGLSWEKIAALMMQAELVVGNDSAPVNLAGLLDVPSIGILGPTTSNVFAHLPSVSCVTVNANEMSCVGCWFLPPTFVNDPCHNGCAALSNVTVDDVYSAARKVIA
jgi:hypothetical protein